MKNASEIRRITNEAIKRQKEEDKNVLHLLEESAKKKLAEILPEVEKAIEESANKGGGHLFDFVIGRHYSKKDDRSKEDELLRIDKLVASLLLKILQENGYEVSISGGGSLSGNDWVSKISLRIDW